MESESDDDSSVSDASDASDSPDDALGRRSYGQSPQTPASGSRSAASRNEFSGKRSAEKALGKQLAEKRRKKEVKLNTTRTPNATGRMISISNGGNSPSISNGGGPSQQQPRPFSFTCHRCGKPGHKAVDCKSAPK